VAWSRFAVRASASMANSTRFRGGEGESLPTPYFSMGEGVMEQYVLGSGDA
jgi:hypothetical protein